MFPVPSSALDCVDKSYNSHYDDSWFEGNWLKYELLVTVALQTAISVITAQDQQI